MTQILVNKHTPVFFFFFCFILGESLRLFLLASVCFVLVAHSVCQITGLGFHEEFRVGEAGGAQRRTFR